MKNKIDLHDVLHSADSRTVDIIASQYRAVDEKTSRRMYERCVERLHRNNDDTAEFSETYNAEPARRGNIFMIAGVTAVCAAVIGVFVYGLSHMKAPDIKPDQEQPVFFTETVVSTSLTTADTTETTAVMSETAVSYAVTSSISKAVTTMVSNTATASSGSAVQNSSPVSAAATTARAESVNTQNSPPPENNTNSQLEAVIAKGEAASGSFVREEKIAIGELPSDTGRPDNDDIDHIAQQAVKSMSFDEISENIKGIFMVPDFVDNTGSVSEYWLNDDGTDKFVINESERTITRTDGRRKFDIMGSPAVSDNSSVLKGTLYNMGIITIDQELIWPSLRNDTYGFSNIGKFRFGFDTKMITTETQLELLREFNGAVCPRAEMVMSGKIPESSHRLTLTEASQFFAVCESINEMVVEISKKQYYPDYACQTDSERNIFYELDTEGKDHIAGFNGDIRNIQLWITEKYPPDGSHDVIALIRVNGQIGYMSDEWFKYEHKNIDLSLWNDFTNGAVN